MGNFFSAPEHGIMSLFISVAQNKGGKLISNFSVFSLAALSASNLSINQFPDEELKDDVRQAAKVGRLVAEWRT